MVRTKYATAITIAQMIHTVYGLAGKRSTPEVNEMDLSEALWRACGSGQVEKARCYSWRNRPKFAIARADSEGWLT